MAGSSPTTRPRHRTKPPAADSCGRWPATPCAPPRRTTSAYELAFQNCHRVAVFGPGADRAYRQFIVTIRHQNRSAPAHRRLGHGARPRRRSAAKWPRPCSRTRLARPQAELETARQAPAELSDQPE
ncbi:hypothetical protein [Actinoallomurus liliacearum]|uniref:hypothetical protein n=1 Tax=Actinoallomurus liliacearum TaxID=1080073 RepID=UPI0031EAE984